MVEENANRSDDVICNNNIVRKISVKVSNLHDFLKLNKLFVIVSKDDLNESPKLRPKPKAAPNTININVTIDVICR